MVDSLSLSRLVDTQRVEWWMIDLEDVDLEHMGKRKICLDIKLTALISIGPRRLGQLAGYRKRFVIDLEEQGSNKRKRRK